MKKLLTIFALLITIAVAAQPNQTPLSTVNANGRQLNYNYTPELNRLDSFLRHGGLPIAGRVTIDTGIIYYTDTVSEKLLSHIDSFISNNGVTELKINAMSTGVVPAYSYVIGGYLNVPGYGKLTTASANGWSDLELFLVQNSFQSLPPYYPESYRSTVSHQHTITASAQGIVVFYITVK